MVIKQGDIYWVDAEEPVRSAPGYRHPYVVIQNDATNQSRISTVVVCALTSNLRRAGVAGNILLAEGEGGLPKPSVVLTSQVMTFDKSELREYIGALSRKVVRKILNGVNLILEPREYEEKPNVN